MLRVDISIEYTNIFNIECFMFYSIERPPKMSSSEQRVGEEWDIV